jgi:chromosome segregation protein
MKVPSTQAQGLPLLATDGGAIKPRLKTLELHGYKTFASRTAFEFPGLITAVVGPNGSGKSNIADSLRWVLGEQSYSLLRGRKTEDMIFAGSEQRSRAGMASATIVFDNSDGWLPIDYSEVALTRRAYRDGQNEYLLNGQKVRLKEISELLGQSGLSERTYTIIGQGLVDAALSLKPEERRRFFEEAAGIGLYRGRREESLTRLENTRRNLERVQDILAELGPRLQSLEKQARRAIEYERVKADLRVLLRDWYGYHWHRVQQDLTHAREVTHTQELRQVQSRERLEAVEAELEVQRQAVLKKRTRLNELHAQSAELHRLREKVNRDLAVMDERQRANQDQSQNAQGDLARLEEESNGLEERNRALEQEVSHLKQELAEAQEQMRTAQAAHQARLKERDKIDSALRDARRAVVNSETRQVQLRAHRTELTGRKENLETTLQSLRQGLMREIQSLTDARNRLEETGQRRSQLEADRRKVEEEIAGQRQALQDGETRRRQVLDVRGALDTERTRLRAQLDVLDQAEKSFSGLNQGARFLLQAARQGKLRGQYQALSAVLQVPAEYETAIASVLGEFLDGIVLNDPDQAEDALQLLEQGDKGRAVLFTGSKVDEDSLSPLIDDPDCLGIAADLLKAEGNPDRLVRALLGKTLVVRNRAAARRWVAKIPVHVRLVTLKGEIFYANGVIVAGQEGRSGLIARPRQKKEMQDRLREVEQKLAETVKTLAETDQQLAGLREAAQTLDKRLRQMGQDLAAANQQYQQANLAVEQSKQRHDWQRGQITSTEGQIQKTEAEIGQQQAEIERLDGQAQRLNDEVRQHSRALANLPVDELQAQVAHWSTGAAVADRAVKEAQRRLDEHQRVVQSSRQRLSVLRQRLESLKASSQELESLKNTLRTEEGQLNQRIEALQQEIDPAEQELSQLEERYSGSQADQQAAQQAALVADRYATQSQLELSRVREAMDALRRRIEEDFGLVAFEYNPDMTGQTPLPLDGMVEQLPMLTELAPEIEESINRQRGQLRRMGAINPDAHKEYLEVKERHEFLIQQVEDLKKADLDLRQVIAELDELMRKEFRKTFDAVAIEFKQMFTRMFGGGSARLILVDEEHPTETGIDIEARLPGRREQGLSLLSGGERSLTAVALIFALLKISPTPFCVMDEVDAMLDEANVGRFCELLKELSQRTQFIVITHNRNTVQSADVIYGVTMGRDSASQVISLRLDEVSEDMVR